MSWNDTTTVSIPIHSVGLSATGEPVPLVALPDVIKLLKAYGVEVSNLAGTAR